MLIWWTSVYPLEQPSSPMLCTLSAGNLLNLAGPKRHSQLLFCQTLVRPASFTRRCADISPKLNWCHSVKSKESVVWQRPQPLLFLWHPQYYAEAAGTKILLVLQITGWHGAPQTGQY